MEKLKPCPFCGHSSLRQGLRNIYCTVCGSEGPVSGNEPSFDWNTRATPERESVVEVLTNRLQYLLVDKGEGKITDMRILAEDLVYILNDQSRKSSDD